MTDLNKYAALEVYPLPSVCNIALPEADTFVPPSHEFKKILRGYKLGSCIRNQSRIANYTSSLLWKRVTSQKSLQRLESMNCQEV
jgi:hypothetical protein